ncbi:MAG: hypothetical protein Q7T18_12500, partial [Sedimentisphaerales bacterium]|nr:hypothetical protein [Sedimentisphaerales bacterium]
MVKALLNNGSRILISAVLIMQLTGCGTLMYPERKGQKGGKIDAGIAVLDGIGLLFFLIPGIIAYAVDFNNGTIYLPGTFGSAVDTDKKKIKQISFDPKHSTMASIEKIIQDETGYDVKMYQNNVQVSKLKS